MWRRFDGRAGSESWGFLCNIGPLSLQRRQRGVCCRVLPMDVAKPPSISPSFFGSSPGIPGPAVTDWKTGGDGSDPPLDTLFESRAPTPGVSLPVPPGGGRSRPIYPCGKARIRAEAEGGKRAPAGPEIGTGFDRESGRRIARCEGGTTS